MVQLPYIRWLLVTSHRYVATTLKKYHPFILTSLLSASQSTGVCLAGSQGLKSPPMRVSVDSRLHSTPIGQVNEVVCGLAHLL